MAFRFTLLQVVAAFAFVMAVFALFINSFATFAPWTIKVFDQKGNLIGNGIIPHDGSGEIFWSFWFSCYHRDSAVDGPGSCPTLTIRSKLSAGWY